MLLMEIIAIYFEYVCSTWNNAVVSNVQVGSMYK